jgi:chloramphenicol 3-O phosphotransferase
MFPRGGRVSVAGPGKRGRPGRAWPARASVAGSRAAAGTTPVCAARCPYSGAVTTDVIVLNGGSSSGKSGIARCLQAVLPGPWLAVGVDMLIQALPAAMRSAEAGIGFAADGGVSVGPQFRAAEDAWMAGAAAMGRAGARVIIDDAFLGGAASQQRWQRALDGLAVLWVAVTCDGAVAAGRELARGDRVPGMALSQADLVHRGVVYDLTVDTTRTEALECARAIAARVSSRAAQERERP